MLENEKASDRRKGCQRRRNSSEFPKDPLVAADPHGAAGMAMAAILFAAIATGGAADNLGCGKALKQVPPRTAKNHAANAKSQAQRAFQQPRGGRCSNAGAPRRQQQRTQMPKGSKR